MPLLLPPSFFFRNRVSYPKPSGQSESTSFASGLPETLVSHCRSCPCPPLYSLDSTHILPFLGILYSLHPRQCLERRGSSQKRPDELRPYSLEPRRQMPPSLLLSFCQGHIPGNLRHLEAFTQTRVNPNPAASLLGDLECFISPL